MVFRNPLVDSGFLGVSPGAAFGASLAIVFLGGAPATVQGSAAAFALLGMAASYLIAQRIRFGDWVLRLVLAGIIVSATLSSATGVVKYLADPLQQLPDITFWMLGGLWAITWRDVLHMLPVVLPCLVVLYLMRWRLNLLSLRDETAFSLGVAPGRERLVIVVAAVAATAAVVSKAGQVGWVGLIVPHIARRLVGSDARRALPASMLLGTLLRAGLRRRRAHPAHRRDPARAAHLVRRRRCSSWAWCCAGRRRCGRERARPGAPRRLVRLRARRAGGAERRLARGRGRLHHRGAGGQRLGQDDAAAPAARAAETEGRRRSRWRAGRSTATRAAT